MPSPQLLVTASPAHHQTVTLIRSLVGLVTQACIHKSAGNYGETAIHTSATCTGGANPGAQAPSAAAPSPWASAACYIYSGSTPLYLTATGSEKNPKSSLGNGEAPVIVKLGAQHPKSLRYNVWVHNYSLAGSEGWVQVQRTELTSTTCPETSPN